MSETITTDPSGGEYHEGPTHWRFPRVRNPNSEDAIVAYELCSFGHVVAGYHGPWAGSLAEDRAGQASAGHSRIVRCYGATEARS